MLWHGAMAPVSPPRPPARGSAARLPIRPARDPGWDALLVFVAVYAADSVGRLQSLFPILQPLKPALVCAACAIALYMIRQSGFRRLDALRSGTTTSVLLLLLWAVLSVPSALNQATAFFFITDVFIKTVLLYVLVAGAVRSVRDVERLAFVYFASAALYSAIVLLRFDLRSGDWRLESLYTYDANDFATFTVTAIPLGLYFVTSRARPLVRLGCALGLAALTIAFIRSGSRGGFLAAIAVAIFVLVGHTAIRMRWRVIGTAVIAAIFLATASDRYWAQMRTITSSGQDYNRTAQSGRLKIWRRGVDYMFSHPVLGVGAANYGVAEGTISPLAKLEEHGIGVPWTTAHNSFVQVGAELGIPGLLFLIMLIWSAFAMLRRVARVEGPLAQALTGSLIGFVVGGFFLSLAYADMFYVLLGLAAGLGKVMRPYLGTPTRRSQRVRPSRPGQPAVDATIGVRRSM